MSEHELEWAFLYWGTMVVLGILVGMRLAQPA